MKDTKYPWMIRKDVREEVSSDLVLLIGRNRERERRDSLIRDSLARGATGHRGKSTELNMVATESFEDAVMRK
jgi:hypothetical protein